MSPLALAFSAGTVWGAVVAVVVGAVTRRSACVGFLTVAVLAALGGLIGWAVSAVLS